MPLEIDISTEDHPDCRDSLLGKLAELSSDETLEIRSDHDPKPVLQEYRVKNDESLEWDYESDGPDDWLLTVTKTSENQGENEIDVRDIPPQKRHELLLETYSELSVNSSFVLVNDHDPKPLFFEFKSIHGDTFDWEYLKKEKNEYRVQITKKSESEPLPDEASTRVDVRLIPPPDRHKTIFHRFDLLAPGDAMEIVADHDPKPLYHQIEEIHGAEKFEWDYLLEEPGECRVLLAKTDASGTESTEEDRGNAQSNGDAQEDYPELDVRSYKPQKRHDLVFDRYRSLSSGEGFVLVNDHDPKPLYYQMNEEMEGEVRWEYRQQDEGEWKVLIGKE